ncbi:hypothetical protein FACS1894178_2380 [Bacteroidia bacterium]|nr:hypothetical protein FACS1894178_2380 [Bacteroidia bacterium]
MRVDYDMYIMFQAFPYYSSTLEFNNSKSLFTFRQASESPNSKKTSKLIKGSDIGNFTIKVDTTIGRMFANMDNDVLLSYNTKTMLIDSLNCIKWKLIQDSVKTIANYNCFMAIGYFRGCVYTVWYTPDISTCFGPWKLSGCPGLILEATRDDKILSFYATKISSEKHYAKVDTANLISTTYAQRRRELIDDANKDLEESTSREPRGSTYVVPYYIRCLECDYINELKRYSTRSFRKWVTYQITDDDPEIK